MAEWHIVCEDVIRWAEAYDGPPFHAMLLDPPYHLTSITRRFGDPDSAPAQYGRDGAFGRMSKGFMGQAWDGGDVAFQPETWYALGQHLLPGGFIISFASGRGYHRMMVAMEDAGLEMHHNLFLWAQGQGFTKATRVDRHFQRLRHGWDGKGMNRLKPAIGNWAMLELSLARRLELWRMERAFQGHRYGQQTLAPKVEPIILAQRPYEADAGLYDIIKTGAGVLNVDDCRIPGSWKWGTVTDITSGGYNSKRPSEGHVHDRNVRSHLGGRWPSNFILCHTPECRKIGVSQVKNRSGSTSDQDPSSPVAHVYSNRERVGFKRHGNEDGYELVDTWACTPQCPVRLMDEQSDHAAHFFFQADWSLDVAERLADAVQVQYVPKVSSARERNAGLGGFPDRTRHRVNPGGLENEPRWAPIRAKNDHPTLKPITLTKYLATLLLPPSMYAPRRILIPFAGVISEAIGGLLAGWDEIVTIEQNADYCSIGRARMAWWAEQYERGLREVNAILAQWEAPAQTAIDPGYSQPTLFDLRS